MGREERRRLFIQDKHHRDRGSFTHEPLGPQSFAFRRFPRKTEPSSIFSLSRPCSRVPPGTTIARTVNINFDTLHAGSLRVRNYCTVFRRMSARLNYPQFPASARIFPVGEDGVGLRWFPSDSFYGTGRNVRWISFFLRSDRHRSDGNDAVVRHRGLDVKN